MTALIWPATAVTISTILITAALQAWRGWLDLRRLEIASQSPAPEVEQDAGTRIEMAAIRERLRRLEAIATGVDL
jgi:hypothetical protein